MALRWKVAGGRWKEALSTTHAPESGLTTALRITRWASFPRSVSILARPAMGVLFVLRTLDLSYEWSTSLEKGMLTRKSSLDKPKFNDVWAGILVGIVLRQITAHLLTL